MSKLPYDVITDILRQLPVKALLRFRSLSKPICSLIDGPDFIKYHLSHSLQTKSNFSLILKDWYLYTVDFDSLDIAVELTHPFQVGGGIEAVGSCNGLVALRNSERDLAFYNISTRKFKRLPVSEIEPPSDSLKTGYVFYGFGYDSVHDDYKLLRIVQFVGEDNACERFDYDYEVKIYGLKSNSWKKIKDLPYILRFLHKQFYHVLHRRGYGVFACQALHWVVPERPELDIKNAILGFDIVGEKFYEALQPDYGKRNMNCQVDVAVLDGCLCVICNYYRHASVDLWVMKEYGVNESWTKLFAIQNLNKINNIVFLRPLSYSKEGDKVLLEVNDGKLFWYYWNEKRSKRVRVSDAPKSFGSEMYVESLVPLQDDVENECKKKKEQEEHDKRKTNRKKRDDFLSVGFKLKL